MKKTLLLLAIPFLIGGLTFASPALDQLQTLSEAILQTSQDKNKDLQSLKNIFTACKEENPQAETKQLCTSFLESSFPLLEAKRKIYREEELQIPLIGEVQLTEIGHLSAEQVKKAVGIYQALSGNTQAINDFGGMNEWRRGEHPYTPPEDIKYYLVSLPEEQFSFLITSESQTSEEATNKLITQLPENRNFQYRNRDFREKSMEYLKKSPITIEQTGGTVTVVSYRLAGGDNSSGGLTLFFQGQVGFEISKYQLPAYATFEETINNMRFYQTITDFLGTREEESQITWTGGLDSLTRYFTQTGNTKENREDSILSSLHGRPLYTGEKEGLLPRTFPFGKNMNTLIQQGKIKIQLGIFRGTIFIRNEKTPQVFYKISPKEGRGFLSHSFNGSYAIDVNNEDGSPSFIIDTKN